jgi:DNA-binding NtrC family response regulator
MNEDARTLYCVGEKVPASLQARLEERAWRVEMIEPGDHFWSAHRFDCASAGLLDFSTCQRPLDFPALYGLLSNSQVGWVAMCHPENIEDAAVVRLIRDYFFTYVTQPTSNDRIADAVDRAYGMASLHESTLKDERDGRAEGEMVGSCDAMLALFRSIRKLR